MPRCIVRIYGGLGVGGGGNVVNVYTEKRWSEYGTLRYFGLDGVPDLIPCTDT